MSYKQKQIFFPLVLQQTVHYREVLPALAWEGKTCSLPSGAHYRNTQSPFLFLPLVYHSFCSSPHTPVSGFKSSFICVISLCLFPSPSLSICLCLSCSFSLRQEINMYLELGCLAQAGQKSLYSSGWPQTLHPSSCLNASDAGTATSFDWGNPLTLSGPQCL